MPGTCRRVIAVEDIMAQRKSHAADKAPSQRQLRVGELIRHALADMLTRGEVHDPVLEATSSPS